MRLRCAAVRALAVAAAMTAASVQAGAREGVPPSEAPLRAMAPFAFPEFGPPVVLVEAERPEHPDDRRAAGLLAKSLVARGIRCADGEEARGRGRAAADRAVESGASAQAARSAVDRPGVDFVARIGIASKDAGSTQAYGIQIAAVECAVRVSLIRASDQSVLEVAPSTMVSRASSTAAAARDAEFFAVERASAALESAVRSDWDAVAQGRRPWIVELVAPSAAEVDRAMGILGGGAVLLDNRPGVRTLVQASGTEADALVARAGASTVVRRPGYVVLAPASDPDAPASPAWIVAAALVAVSLAAGAFFLLRPGRRIAR